MNTPFKPEFLPLENIDWEDLIPLIGQASQSTARFDGYLGSMLRKKTVWGFEC